MLTRLINTMTNILLPGQCHLCHCKLNHNLLCSACGSNLPHISTSCCGICHALLNTQTNTVCGQCLREPPPFRKIHTLFSYDYPIDGMIMGIKFAQQLSTADLLGKLLLEKIKDWYQHTALPECLIPVPLHTKRLRQRGYNQAIEIARPIGKALGLPMDISSIKRVKATLAQAELPEKQRAANIKGAFALQRALLAKHVVIIDDVITTGHTVSELATTLKQAGAETVDVWCCARTLLAR